MLLAMLIINNNANLNKNSTDGYFRFESGKKAKYAGYKRLWIENLALETYF